MNIDFAGKFWGMPVNLTVGQETIPWYYDPAWLSLIVTVIALIVSIPSVLSTLKGVENKVDNGLNELKVSVNHVNDSIVMATKEVNYRLSVSTKQDGADIGDFERSGHLPVELDPNDIEAWYNKGIILNSQGKYDKAIIAFNEVIRLDPKFHWGFNNKGWALYKIGKLSEAMQAYDIAIKLNPNYAAAWNNKGEVLKALGKTAEADAALAKARELTLASQR